MVTLLSLGGISKSFPGVRALDEVRFDLMRGEVHALMGENGAGKSTLIKILCGAQRPDAGEIRIDGEPVEITDPARAAALGISTVHQELHLQPFLTVAENIFLGRQPLSRFGLINRSRMAREAREILERLGTALTPTALVGDLSIAERQIVAIAQAISTRSRIVVFDEPTSSLTQREADLLLAMIRRLRAQGLGILYVSHRMEEIFGLCDRITVFRDGRYVGTKAVSETTLPEIVHMMIGRHILDQPAGAAPAPADGVALEVKSLSRSGLLADVSFTLRRGEIVGLAGLVGSGRTELARAIFGDLGGISGTVAVAGKPLVIRSPRDAIAAGIGLVPEDRKEQGLVTALSIQQNISMPQLKSLRRLGILDLRQERRLAASFVEQLSIKTPSIDQKTMLLSGGNQQRVVIAKWLATKPRVLIVDEPTRGVDVGAKAGIHALIRELAGAGMAILMISSDLPEVLAVSHRILVMHRGRLAADLPAAEASQDRVMHLAMGLA